MRSYLRLAGVFLFALSTFAQSDRGTITGTVSDPAGAVVAGAAIEAKNVATGAVYQGASSATGNYTIAQLPAGAYQLISHGRGVQEVYPHRPGGGGCRNAAH